MKANELRIGNYVSHNTEWNYAGHSGAFQWSERDWVAVGESTLFLENVTPVTIKEFWVFALGLNKRIVDVHGNFIHVTEVSDLNNSISWRFYRNNEPLGDFIYVHQLQNLYHALTGEELTIKPIEV